MDVQAMQDGAGHAASHNDARLVKMANQIATFFASQPSVEASHAVAAHLNDFWSPPMRARLIEMIAAGADALRPEVAGAGPLIRRPGQRPVDVLPLKHGVPPTREGDEGMPDDPRFRGLGQGSDAG